jgi:NAD(P)-dependent dehydrogenase (short-subunit alcohol dehydrogenase family)
MGCLAEKVIAVVGGTSGIGYSAARAFVGEGARVVAIGLAAEEVGRTVTALGADRVEGFAGDATDGATAAQAVAAAVGRWGRLDGLFHVAGGSARRQGDGPLHELTDEGVDRALEWNLRSVIFSNRAAVRQFLRQGGGGSILNTGSVLADSPSPIFFATHAYAAAKAGITGFSRGIAAYYAPQNIRVNVLAPGLTETPMAQRALADARIMAYVRTKQPLDGGRPGQVSDLDGAAVYFMSDASRFTTGQVLGVDGGWSVSEGRP